MSGFGDARLSTLDQRSETQAQADALEDAGFERILAEDMVLMSGPRHCRCLQARPPARDGCIRVRRPRRLAPLLVGSEYCQGLAIVCLSWQTELGHAFTSQTSGWTDLVPA